MSAHPQSHEVEIKLRVPDAAAACALLESHGFRLSTPRTHEWNELLDTDTARLRREGKLLRLRQYGPRRLLTYKGPSLPGKHKEREEIEIEVEDLATVQTIFHRLGYTPTFRYEKYRTEYVGPAGGVVTVDETPIGVFLEMEGDPAWIDATAAALGFAEKDYITASYGRLFVEYCQQHGLRVQHMEFAALGKPLP